MKQISKTFCLIVGFLFFQPALKADEKQVIINLMQRPLNYVDLGIINLEKDMEKSIDRIIARYTSPLLTNLIGDRKEEIEMSVIYNWKKTAVIASVSLPVTKGLTTSEYLSSSNKCRQVFDLIRQTLLKAQPESTISSSQVASYLVEKFYPPTNQPWVLPESYRKSLVKIVLLEIVLRPTNKYAFASSVNSISCIGNLSDQIDNIKIVHDSTGQ